VAAIVVGACSSPGASGSAFGIGSPAPSLQGTTLDGAAIDLASLRGHPVVLNFWGSYCVPCRSEFPVLEDALTDHAGDGLEIVGVLFNDSATAARAFVDEFGATWPTVTDPDGAAAKAYRVVAPPQTYFIDADGVLRAMQIGEMQRQDFEQQYQKIAP
jgi:cytochrome c biogenesis protein CcmG/thiol:disulfide interchange protein DsbE